MMDQTFLIKIAIFIIPLVFAITVHEAAHGYVARYFGDNTAYYQGRVTLNPLKHIDLVGTILVPLIFIMLRTGIIFGWAKPVPVNWYNLRNPVRDAALVAAAGPLANLVMMFIWLGVASFKTPVLFAMGKFGIDINLMLLLLNLIPVPPLDGSRIIAMVLPAKAAMAYMRLEPYGLLILLLLIFSGALFWVLEPTYYIIEGVMMGLIEQINPTLPRQPISIPVPSTQLLLDFFRPSSVAI